MNSAIKIIKRGTSGKLNNVPLPPVDKTESERKRDTASTVQEWVVEWAERKRSLQIAAVVFVRALDQSSPTSGTAVAAN